MTFGVKCPLSDCSVINMQTEINTIWGFCLAVEIIYFQGVSARCFSGQGVNGSLHVRRCCGLK